MSTLVVVVGVLAAVVALVLLVAPMLVAGRHVERDIFRARPKSERRRLLWGQMLFVAAAIGGALALLALIGRL